MKCSGNVHTSTEMSAVIRVIRSTDVQDSLVERFDVSILQVDPKLEALLSIDMTLILDGPWSWHRSFLE